MYAGQVVEQGTLDEIFYDPQHPYTWGLLGSLTRLDQPRPQRLPQISGAPPSLLDAAAAAAPSAPRCPHEFGKCTELPGLEARLPERRRPPRPLLARARARSASCARSRGGSGWRRPRDERQGRARCSRSPTWSSTSRSSAGLLIDREVDQVRAVDGVSFSVARGRDAGPGRRVGLRQVDRSAARSCSCSSRPRARSRFEGREIAGLSRREMRPLRREMQMIFQDPYASLNPRKRVGQIVGDPLQTAGRRLGRRAAHAGCRSCSSGSASPPEHYNRFPHEFSGGQRQRIGIARALALRAEADRRRRAGLRPRRLDPGPDRQPARRPPGRARPHLRLRRPRHRRRPPRLRPDRGDARRQDRRGRGPPTRSASSPRDAYTKKLLAAVPIPDPRESRRAARGAAEP